MLRVLFLNLSFLPTHRVKTLPSGVNGTWNIAKSVSAMWELGRLQTLLPLHAELHDVRVSVPCVWPSHSRMQAGAQIGGKVRTASIGHSAVG